MTWNAGLPGDNQKIRELGQVIRPNWVAIEDGDDVPGGTGNMLKMRSVQLANRTGLAINENPVTEATTHYLYSWTDTGAVPLQEAYMEDAAGGIIQLSNDGGIGGPDVRLNFNDLTNDDGTTVYDERNFVAYWATVNAAGVIQDQSGGLTAVRNSLGVFTITFTVAQANANYGVVCTAEQAPGNLAVCHYSLKTVNDFVVRIVNQGATKVDKPFTISVFGGRPA